MFLLGEGYDGSALVCPHCDSQLSIDWTTEYGNPLEGDHYAQCPTCDNQFIFSVETTTIYTPRKE